MARRLKPSESTATNRAVGYVRVSTEAQATEGVSLDAQADRVQAYCVSRGLELVDLIREEGVSGSVPLSQRQGGAELLAALEGGRAAHVVALKLDRLFRDAADALNQTKAWDASGAALHLVDMGGQSLSTASAMGRMFLTMTAAFAELERNLISERTRSALSHKREKGEAVSRAPRGMRIEAGRLAPDPQSDGLAIASRAAALRSEGKSFAAIGALLYREGFRPERGRKFHASTVRYLLLNPRLVRDVAA